MGQYLDSRIKLLLESTEKEVNKDPVILEWILRLLWQGDHTAALNTIHEAERLVSISTAVLLRKTEREIRAEQYSEAIANLALVANQYFDPYELELQIAIGLSIDEQLEQANGLAHDLLDHQPQVSAALLFLSRFHQEKGNLCTSVTYALRYVLQEPMDVEAYSVLAALLMELGEEDASKRLALGGLMLERDDECCNVTTCMLAIIQGQHTFAGRRLHRTVKLYPESGRAWLALTYKDMFLGSWQEALGSAVKASVYLPNERVSWSCLGWCQLMLTDLIGAAHSYSEVLNIDPQDSEARGALALIALLSDKLEEAQKWIIDAQKNNPTSSSAQVVGILTLLSAGNSEVAYDHFVRLIEKGAKSFIELLALLSVEQKKKGKIVIH